MARFGRLLVGGLLIAATWAAPAVMAPPGWATTQPTVAAPGRGPEARVPCRTAARYSRAGEELPLEVRGFDGGSGLSGSGALWTLPDAATTHLYYRPIQRDWRLKQPWFRTKAGNLRISARPVDGGGRFRAEVPERGAYPDVGFMPTSLAFSDGGCWRVVARLGRSKVVLAVAVPSGDAGICTSLDEQLTVRIDTPANAAFYEAADREYARLGCGA